MKFLLVFTVLLHLITSQEFQEYTEYDYEEEEQLDLRDPLAVGAFALLSYLALDLGAKGLKDAVKPHLTDYPDCGTREPAVENEADIFGIEGDCTSRCIWYGTDEIIYEFSPEIYTIDYPLNNEMEMVTMNVELVRVPYDNCCLDSCVSKIDPPGSAFSKYKRLCDNSGLSKFDCYILDRSISFEDDTTNSTSNKGLYYTPKSELDILMSYCMYEQYLRASNQDVPSAYTSSTTSSLFCSELLGIPYTDPGTCQVPSFYSNVSTSNTSYPTTTTTTTTIPTQPRYQNNNKHRIHRKDSEKRRIIRQLDQIEDYDFGLAYNKSRNPWVCSLRTTGFRGMHRCGVTMLSGPPRETILVSAAHCNQICKDDGRPIEICCCRLPSDPGSCLQTSSYCGAQPQLQQAQPSDLQIVCGEFSLELSPEKFSPETEVVLEIDKITNHPRYEEGKPINGFDIAVYHITNSKNAHLAREISLKKIFPACLPRNNEQNTDYIDAGRLAGWIDPEPTFKTVQNDLGLYVFQNMLPHETQMYSMDKCKDPDWMQSSTFYPPGTICYEDPAATSCVTFGNSGSPMVRQFRDVGRSRFAWVGTLSLSKGCDRSTERLVFSNRYKSFVPAISLRSRNPAVFTDARCYLDWIADQYGFKAPVWWKRPESCNKPEGDINDIDRTTCGSSSGRNCDFTKTNRNKCELNQFEGFAYNQFRCNDTAGILANCANNCKGVDPNAVIVGGAAIAFATAASGTLLGQAVVGGGGALALGAGGTALMSMMTSRGCPNSQCRPRGSQVCCNRIGTRGRCPRSC